MNQLSTKVEPVSERHKCANWATVQNVVGVLSGLKTFCAGDDWHHCNALIEFFRQQMGAVLSNSPVSDMDVFSWQEQPLNLIGPESLCLRGKRDIFVSFLAWFLYHGYYWIEYVLTFWSKDVVRTLTLCDIFLVVLAFDKAFSDRNVTSREKLISGAGWERCEAEEGANWKKFVKSWPRHNLLTIFLFSFFFANFMEMLYVIILYL